MKHTKKTIVTEDIQHTFVLSENEAQVVAKYLANRVFEPMPEQVADLYRLVAFRNAIR